MQLRGQDGPLARPLAVCAGRGVFTGYASLFGRREPSGDVVMPGAFAETLRRKGADRIRMLFQHDPAEPVGTWVEIREDHRGLLVTGRLDCNVQRGRELLSLLDSRGTRRTVDRFPHAVRQPRQGERSTAASQN